MSNLSYFFRCAAYRPQMPNSRVVMEPEIYHSAGLQSFSKKSCHWFRIILLLDVHWGSFRCITMMCPQRPALWLQRSLLGRLTYCFPNKHILMKWIWRTFLKILLYRAFVKLRFVDQQYCFVIIVTTGFISQCLYVGTGETGETRLHIWAGCRH